MTDSWADASEDTLPGLDVPNPLTTTTTTTTTSSTSSSSENTSKDDTKEEDVKDWNEKKKVSSSYDDNENGRGEYKQREKKVYDNKPVDVDPEKYPTEAPFTAYIGNLAFSIQKEDIVKFFEKLKVVDVHFPRDRETERMKGFGYVEFETLDELKTAIGMGGQEVLGRSIRIDVTQRRNNNRNQSSSGGGYGSNFRRNRNNRDESTEEYSRPKNVNSEADVADSWRGKKKQPKPSSPSSYGSNNDKDGESKYNNRRNKYGGFNKKDGGDEEQSTSSKKDYSRSNTTRVSTPKVKKENPFGESKAWVPNDFAEKVWEREEQKKKETLEKIKKEREAKKESEKKSSSSSSSSSNTGREGFGTNKKNNSNVGGGSGRVSRSFKSKVKQPNTRKPEEKKTDVPTTKSKPTKKKAPESTNKFGVLQDLS